MGEGGGGDNLYYYTELDQWLLFNFILICLGIFKQTLDSEGNIFIDEDPRDFEYILRALRHFIFVSIPCPCVLT